MAPAITLNRMYHCVPSSIRTMEPMPNPPPSRTRPSSTTGNSAVAGTEAAICASGCATLANRGLKPMATPTGMVHSDAIASDAGHTAETRPGGLQRRHQLRAAEGPSAAARLSPTGTAPLPPAAQQHRPKRNRCGRQRFWCGRRAPEPRAAGWWSAAPKPAPRQRLETQRETSELRSRCRMGEVTSEALSTCSNLEPLRPRDERAARATGPAARSPRSWRRGPTGCRPYRRWLAAVCR